MITYDKKPGNAECTRCGLRASSKNVQIRNVFPIWPEENEHECESFEMGIWIDVVTNDDNSVIVMTGVKPGVKNTKTGKHPTLGKYINDMIGSGLTGDEIEAVLCNHQWKQDPGTNTV